jgi:hypothetical protein
MANNTGSRTCLEKYPETMGGWGVFALDGSPLAWFPQKHFADDFAAKWAAGAIVTRVFVLAVVWNADEPQDDEALEGDLIRAAHEL